MHQTCKVCGKPVTRFIKSTNKWWNWCSNACMGRDPEILEKKSKTNLEKFGVSHPMQLDSTKSKLKQSVQIKYGVDNPAQNIQVKQKTKETSIKNYNIDNPSKNTKIVEKIRSSAVKRYAESKEDILQKRRETFINSIGVASNKHLHIPKESIQLMKDIEWLKDQHYNQKKSCQQIAKELGVSPTPILTFFAANGVDVRRHDVSTVEKEIREFVKTLTDEEIIFNDRNIIKPKEIDIYIPSKNLAIEVNGIYWHSDEQGKDYRYHLSKTQECETQGIKLIHIYDTEWTDSIKQCIVKSKLKHFFGLSTKIPARKCKIVSVDSATANKFLVDNHLQGKCPSRYKIGLTYNGELVSLATVGISRFNKNYKFELLRYCNKINHSVVGGLSKILSYLKKYHSVDSLISYADRRWSNKIHANLYSQAGFKYLRESNPNYKYFNILANDAILYSRNQFQKHMLKSKLENFDPTISEQENMLNHGYFKIWDCGNLVYIKENHEQTTS
jgi:very-short-patch-repair endonuclease